MSLEATSFVNKLSNVVLYVGAASGVGYLCAKAFTSINPVHGAIFCGISTLVGQIVNPIFKSIFEAPGSNGASKLLGTVVSILTGIAASASLATAAGYPMTFHQGMVLSAATLIPVAVIAAIVGGKIVINNMANRPV